ncbi:helix-turn-helix domain-containing protein [Polaribacter sp. IC073]|uniref:helix-turn-helix domain-containing protein n=1 Tax=Polaribacter sp. IC073 TaxID=2508540 RepID=UPI0011BEB13D|nr:helix-turn-helix domain-containing protein [Polaribacter sp. IC073]TXD49757.1 helix-turn-helix domain-containing protein [Polaribacter sp. IC073]
MYRLRKHIIIFLSFSYSLVFYGQNIDSLENKSTDELFNLYESSKKIDDKKSIIKVFLGKAKVNKSKNDIITGYYVLAGLYDDINVLKYSDSIISLTSKNPNAYHPAYDYLTKAYFFQDRYDYVNAIDNYLIVNEYAKKSNNSELIVLANYSIGCLKRKIKEYSGALKLLKENLKYANKLKDNNHKLLSLIEISNIYTETNNIDSLSTYSEQGKKLSLVLKDSISYHHFLTNEAITSYNEENIQESIIKLEKEKQFFERKKESKYLLYPYFYLANANIVIDNKKEALKYFKKVDSIHQIEQSVSPFVKDAYSFLISHYKKSGNLEIQLKYVNRLIAFDSIINTNSLFLNKRIYKEYDIPKLNAEKKIIIATMQKKEHMSLIVLIALFVVLIIVSLILRHQYKKRKFYKNKVEIIMTTTTTTTTTINNSNNIDIPKDIVDEVLLKLEKFELDKKYLSNKVTLNSLAKDLSSNTNYLSKIINHYKGLSFSNYLNTLRINFIVSELKVNSLYRKFTVKAIAEEAGFNNSESFSKAFYKITNVKPSFFMKQLEENY